MTAGFERGSRQDPEWAWYWAEADREEQRGHKGSWGSVDPLSYRVQTLTADDMGPLAPLGEAAAAPIAEVALVLRWLPLRLRLPYERQVEAGGRRRDAKAAQEALGIEQSAWSHRIDTAEEWIGHLAPIARRMAAQGLDPSFEAAVETARWPQILRAVVDSASTPAAAVALGLAQSTVWSRWVRMGTDSPMIAGLIEWRSINRSNNR